MKPTSYLNEAPHLDESNLKAAGIAKGSAIRAEASGQGPGSFAAVLLRDRPSVCPTLMHAGGLGFGRDANLITPSIEAMAGSLPAPTKTPSPYAAPTQLDVGIRACACAAESRMTL